MKNSILSLSLLCLTIITTRARAQENNLLAYHYIDQGDKKPTLRAAKNNDYLIRISTLEPSEQLRSFQQKLANFDIASLQEYSNKEPSIYSVTFRERNFSAYARYSSNGDLISTIERYTNIVPLKIRRKIAIQYPGWSFKNGTLIIKYKRKGRVNIAYRVHILNGSKKRILKVPV